MNGDWDKPDASSHPPNSQTLSRLETGDPKVLP